MMQVASFPALAFFFFPLTTPVLYRQNAEQHEQDRDKRYKEMRERDAEEKRQLDEARAQATHELAEPSFIRLTFRGGGGGGTSKERKKPKINKKHCILSFVLIPAFLFLSFFVLDINSDLNKQSFTSSATGSVQDRIKRNVHYIQRTAAHGDNFLQKRS